MTCSWPNTGTNQDFKRQVGASVTHFS